MTSAPSVYRLSLERLVALLPLRFRPFVIKPALRQLAGEPDTACLSPAEADLTTLLLQ